MLRKGLMLALVVAQLVGFAALIAWRVAEWNAAGWAGMAYNIDSRADRDRPTPAFFWGAGSRTVEMVAPGGPAARAGIVAGDEVASVNGIAVAEIDRLADVAERARSGDGITYRVRGSSGERDVTLRLEPPYRYPLVVFATGTSVVVGAIFLLMSLLVFWSRPRSQVALVFFLVCVFGAAEYLVYAALELDIPSLRGVAPATVGVPVLLGLLLVGVLTVALIDSLLHLALVFPRTRPIVKRWPEVTVWVHLAPFSSVIFATVVTAVGLLGRWPAGTVVAACLMAVGASAAVLRLRQRSRSDGWLRAVMASPWWMHALVAVLGAAGGFGVRALSRDAAGIAMAVLFVCAMVVSMLFIVVFSVITTIALYRSYRESGLDEQRQLWWPLWGTLTAVGGSLVLMIVTIVISIVFGHHGTIDYTTNVLLGAVGKVLYLVIPVSLAFGIVKYRLMEIDVIIRKTLIYSVVTGFVLVVYLLLAGVSGLAIVRSAGLESQVATVVATLLVVALFVPMRNRVQRLVDRFFFRRERDTQASIGRVAETVMQATSLETMCLEVAEEVQRALGCRTVAILVRRAGSDRLIAEATVGLPDRASVGITLPSSTPVLEAASVHVVVDRDALSEEERHVAQKAAAVRAAICRRGDEPVGLITIGRKLSREPFDDEDEVFLEAVAGQLAIGLGRLRGRRAELEFTQALQIQRSLLPAEIPQIGGVEVAARWQPAREVSGDYYDVLRLSDDKLAVCIGDVVGKGMPAALLMSSLQAAVKAVAAADADPGHVCTQVRSVVTSNLQGGKFVTFFFAVVDGGGRRLTYTNCGHNQPVLVREDGTAQRLTEGGPAFARLMRDLPYRTGEAALESGDRLVLFTDGVSEASDGDGEQFGEDRVV
ncbi:MAG: SpoIIE family protein phosphatase, partial [Thermoanaerobaculales bacterium]|nr:SpoIIE family protein phosphatase [Thermoanaerobaculales bacterium]